MSPKFIQFKEFTIPADLSLVSDMAAEFTADLKKYSVPEDTSGLIELAFVEGLNNAVEHGCENISEAQVKVRWAFPEDLIIIEISDPGSYSPNSNFSDNLPDDDLSERGRGHFLMNQIMDLTRHTNEGGFHILRMEKRIKLSHPLSTSDDNLLNDLTSELSSSYESLSAVIHFSESLATALSFNDFYSSASTRCKQLVDASRISLFIYKEQQSALEEFQPFSHHPRRFPLENNYTICETFNTRTETTIESCKSLPPVDPMHWAHGCCFVCPAFFKDRVIGILTAYRKKEGDYFTAGQLSLIRIVADYIAIAWVTEEMLKLRKNQERALRELEIASEIQESLLPTKFPNYLGYSINGMSRTALEAGGDYFDVIETSPGHTLIAIADVMGKGIPAALLASMIRSYIIAYLELADSPGKLLAKINHKIFRDLEKLSVFASCQIAYLSTNDHTLKIANAGHCPVLYKRTPESEDYLHLNPEGTVLGIYENQDFEEMTIPIEKGSEAIMITDGIYELENEAGKMLDISGASKQLIQYKQLSSRATCAQMLEFLKFYHKDPTPADDQTLVVIKREL